MIKKLFLMLGGKKLIKYAYEFLIRPELVKLSFKIDPTEKTQIDDNIIKMIDQIIEDLT